MPDVIDKTTGTLTQSALDQLSDEQFEMVLGDTEEAKAFHDELVDEFSDQDPAVEPPAHDDASGVNHRTPESAVTDEQGGDVPSYNEVYEYDIPQYNGEELVSFSPEQQDQIKTWAYTKMAAQDPRVVEAFTEDGVMMPADMDEVEMLKANSPHLYLQLKQVADRERDRIAEYANAQAFYTQHANEINGAEAVRAFDLLLSDMQNQAGADFESAEIAEVKSRFNAVLSKIQDMARSGDPNATYFYQNRAGVPTLSSDALFALAQNELRDINAEFIREATAMKMQAQYSRNRSSRTAPRPVQSIAQGGEGAPGGDGSIGIMPWEELSAPDGLDRLIEAMGNEDRGMAEYERQMNYYDNQYMQEPSAPVRRPVRAVH